MDKLAQQRSWRSKIWENVNLTGKALEGLHAELADVMEKMRVTDAEIRDIAADIKPLIRSAKSNLRQRDYLNAAHQITGFHARIRTIAHILDTFYKDIEIGHYKYFLNDFDEPQKEELFKYDPNAEIKSACEEFDAILKEAGAYDWIKDKMLSGKDIVTDTASNIITNKGRARRLLEKRFNTAFVKQIKDSTIILVNKSEKMLRELISIFSDLESGISRRNPKLYINKAKEFVSKFKIYHAIYVKYYSDIIVPLKQQQEAINTADKEQTAKNETDRQNKAYDDYNKKTVEDNDRYEQQIREQSQFQQSAPPRYTEPSFTEWKKKNAPQEFSEEENEKEKQKKLDELEKNLGPVDVSKAHSKFINQITIYATENETSSFINELLEYSDRLEETDPEASANLLTVAHKIINDYKIAGIFDLFKGKPAVTRPAEETEIGTDTPEAGIPIVEQPKVEEQAKKPIRPGLQYLKQKPQELINERQNLLRPQKLDLPEGRIDTTYTNIGFLQSITPERIRITPKTSEFIINTFAKRLAAKLKINDLEPYMSSIEEKFIPLLKRGIYNGWVIQSYDVMDEFNPQDKYLEIYTRLNLSDITDNLSGTAKLHVTCRVSANHKTLTIKDLKNKYFAIEVDSLEEPEEVEDYDYEEDNSRYDID